MVGMFINTLPMVPCGRRPHRHRLAPRTTGGAGRGAAVRGGVPRRTHHAERRARRHPTVRQHGGLRELPLRRRTRSAGTGVTPGGRLRPRRHQLPPGAAGLPGLSGFGFDLAYDPELFDARPVRASLTGVPAAHRAGRRPGPARRAPSPDDRRGTAADPADGNGTQAGPPADTLGALFAAQAARTPHAEAVSCGEDARLRHPGRIGPAGSPTGSPDLRRRTRKFVALALPRCTDLVVAVLAVLKTGAACAHPPPRCPPNASGSCSPTPTRWHYHHHGDGSREWAYRFLPLDDPAVRADLDRRPAAGPAPRALPESPAYAYTSGSTGRPRASSSRTPTSSGCSPAPGTGSAGPSTTCGRSTPTPSTSVWGAVGPAAARRPAARSSPRTPPAPPGDPACSLTNRSPPSTRPRVSLSRTDAEISTSARGWRCAR
ncbi:hypothetical protein LT493_15600 [Streptomyces tricolor]|nr:hypothetical protein [Streptomyces tricolor]